MTASRRASSRQPWLAGATISEMDGVRYLHLGTEWVQGAMRIRRPRALQLEYVQRMMAWLLWRPQASVTDGIAVQLGLGAGALARAARQLLSMPTVVVEINPSVVEANRLWFHLPPQDEHFAVHVTDARRWLETMAPPGAITWLGVDLYDHDAAAPVLDDLDFYRACWRCLDDGGLMSVNLFGRDASFERSAACIAEAFGADQVWQLTPTREGNTIVVAGRGIVVPDRDTLIARADAIEARWKADGMPARQWLKLVRPYRG